MADEERQSHREDTGSSDESDDEVNASEVEVEQSAVRSVRGEKVEIEQSAVVIARAEEMEIEESAVVVAIGRSIELEESNVLVLLAPRVEGAPRALVSLHGIIGFGLGFLLARWLAGRSRRRSRLLW